jgi:ABC-type branched-subunit amino acid transport system substrate-binding protein
MIHSGNTESKGNLTPAELAGKKIYTTGVGSSGEKITANMSGVKVPGTVMKCINCHKADGTGNPEGGISPSNVTWAYLTRPYGGKRISGKKYPAYTEQTLRKVITTGIDPAGNKLHNAMPTYNMTRVDLNNLVAYMKVLGKAGDVGLTKSTIKIGIALNGNHDQSNSKNEAVKKVAQAYCNAINENGGIYNRMLETSFFNANEEFDENKYFMVTGFGEKEILGKNTTTPSLFLCSNEITGTGLNNRNAFYIYPSLTAQNQALVDFSNEYALFKKKDEVTIVCTNDDHRKTLARAISDYYLAKNKVLPTMLTLDSSNVNELALNKDIHSDGLVFFIGSIELGNQFLKELDKLGKSPYILTSGSVSGVDLFNLPKSFQKKVFISYPTWVTERTFAGVQLYQSLNKQNNLLSGWKNSQLNIMSMLMTLEECLKKIGSDLTQDKLIASFEELYEFSTGLAPPVTYNMNRRVGSSMVYIANFDPTVNQLQLVSSINFSEE